MKARQSWDDAYIKFAVTNWERNDLHDLADFIRECGISGERATKILDVGCGRGMRGLLALLGNPGLNVPGTRYVGVDFSGAAIAAAVASAARWRRRIDAHGQLEEIALATRASAIQGEPLRAHVDFVCEDLGTYLGRHERQYQLVVDWMCLHEMPPQNRRRYCQLLGACSNKYLIVNSFSRELSTVADLGVAVPGVRKYQLATPAIGSLFPDFRIVKTKDYPEDLTPSSIITDGIVAGKRAHHLVRH